jgi:DNA-binding transcriptional MerR regulator
VARIGVRKTRDQRLAERVWTPPPKKRRTAAYADRSGGAWTPEVERLALERLAVMERELATLARALHASEDADAGTKLAAANRLRTYVQAKGRFDLHARGRLFEGTPAPKGGRMRVTDVARALGMPVRTLRRWCVEGRVKATRQGGMWMLHALDVSKLLAEAAR